MLVSIPRQYYLSDSLSRWKYYLILFLIWPFLTFLFALTNYREKEARRVVYFFLIYYGLTFFIGGEGYFDAMGYANALKRDHLLPFHEFFNIVGGLYSDTSVDIVSPFISFIISRFTDNHAILFGVYAALFGFFYLKSTNQLYFQIDENSGINERIFLAFFVLIFPITAISGFRMYTAAWIFFLGAYNIIINGDKRYIILALAASLVHFSFLTANAVLLLYMIAGNRNVVYFPITIASFFLPNLLSPYFNQISASLGGALQDRYEGYSSEGYIQGVQEMYEGASWYVTLSSDLVFIFLLVAIVIIQWRTRFEEKTKGERNLYSFLLLFIAFVNFGQGIASFGSRFQTIFYLFGTLYVFLYFIRQNSYKIDLITLLGIFPMLLNIAVTFRIASRTINVWLFSPGLGMPFIPDGTSLADILF